MCDKKTQAIFCSLIGHNNFFDIVTKDSQENTLALHIHLIILGYIFERQYI